MKSSVVPLGKSLEIWKKLWLITNLILLSNIIIDKKLLSKKATRIVLLFKYVTLRFSSDDREFAIYNNS